MIRVYRLEGEDGDGPYLGYDDLRNAMCDAHTDDVHPGPRQDFGRLPLPNDFYGCETLTQLFDWFGVFFQPLLDIGYRVVEYEVPEEWCWFGKSNRQVCFRRSERITRGRVVPIKF